MTSKFDSKSDSDFYRAQSHFVGELVKFTKSYNVHVHLVAHPRKTEGKLQKDNISGSGDITNRADNVFSVERVSDIAAGFDTRITILKNRSEGIKDVEIGLCFENKSKRFYQRSAYLGADKLYGWEDIGESIPLDGVL